MSLSVMGDTNFGHLGAGFSTVKGPFILPSGVSNLRGDTLRLSNCLIPLGEAGRIACTSPLPMLCLQLDPAGGLPEPPVLHL